MRSDPIRSKLCEGCDAHGGLQSLIEQTPRIYRCHAGLVDFSVPIIMGDTYVGAIASGQVRVADTEQPDFLTTGTSWQGDPHLQDLYNKVPVYSRRRIAAAAETLFGLSRSPSIIRDCPLVNLPSHVVVPSAGTSPTAQQRVRLLRLAPRAEGEDADEAADHEQPSESHAALRDALDAEDLATAFSEIGALLDEAFAAEGDLRDHLASIEDLVVAVAQDCAPRAAPHLTHLVQSQRGRRTSSGNRYQSQLYMERLLTMVLDDILRSRPQRRPDLRDLLNEIARHPNRALSLTEASTALHWSPGHLSKLFKSVTGCTFVSYITAQRISRARLMLACTQMPVRKIAVDLGFNQVNYFSRVFRAHTGVSPSEYRRQYSARDGGPAGVSLPAHNHPLLRA
ncbi:AraC-like DNA-binding protein [Brooklawnia cerclae]|uniref:AraC-like DNA-binding protein n=2 Tax=Brooklawnia cerclae TaxID=349934 RepID=A0ABX0SBC8_9ACTN|nr:AraC-like DNA-binding protein [Brooklawnia cerclae]